MIPCLYDSREMKFDHNGIGKLADAQSCTVTEKRNGSYELKLVCPADGIHAEMLEEGNIILAKPSDTMQSQPFRIYKITTPIDGKLEVQARHMFTIGSILKDVAEQESAKQEGLVVERAYKALRRSYDTIIDEE